MSRKFTRRVLASAFCVLIAASSCLTAFAAGNTITIKECDGMQITLPDYMSAVTRSSKEDDPYFSQHGVSYEDVQNSFRNGDNYLQAMDYDNTLTLSVSYLDTRTKDFNEMSDEELFEMQRGFLGGTDANVQYYGGTPDEAGGEMRWLFLNMTINDGKGRNQFQATTVSSGKNIILTLYRNEGNVEPTDYEVLESITRSVTPPQVSWFKRILPFLLIALGIAAAVVLGYLAVKFIKRYKDNHPSKKTRNDKVLEELKGKYLNNKQFRYGKDGEASAVFKKKAAVQVYEDEEYVDIYANSAPKSSAKEQAAAEPEPEKAEPAPEPKEEPKVKAQPKAEPAKEPEKAEAEPMPEPEEEPAAEPKPAPKSYDDDEDEDYGDEPLRKYSDEDIERLLAD